MSSSKLYKLGYLDHDTMLRRELQYPLRNQLVLNNCGSDKSNTTCNQYTLYPAIHRKWDYGPYTCPPNIRYIF